MKKLIIGLFIFSIFIIGFKVYAEVSQASITILSPNGGETVRIGQKYNITWKSSGLDNSGAYIYLKDDSISCPIGMAGCWTAFGIGDNGVSTGSISVTPSVQNTGSYLWDTNKKMFGDAGPNTQPVSVGTKYKIKVCIKNTCDESDNYFTIISSPSSNPIISNISGPISLKVGETGTWITNAYDPNGRTLTYSVVWNMKRCGSTATGWCGSKETNQNSPTFTHSFFNEGSYDIGFMAINDLDFNSGLAETLKVIHLDVGSLSDNNPVISGVSGPQTLNVNQVGTWKISASTSTGGNLSYHVNWGDENMYTTAHPDLTNQQSATFTHSYENTGTYTPIFTVYSENTINCITTPCPSNGGSAKTSLSVKVGDSTEKEIKGCLPGFKFSSITGLPCPTELVNDGCLSGYNFSPMTGQACIVQYKKSCTESGSNCGIINYRISRTLRRGTQGDDVKRLQTFLGIKADGSFGSVTVAKVKEWQTLNGVRADGIFGGESRQKAGLDN